MSTDAADFIACTSCLAPLRSGDVVHVVPADGPLLDWKHPAVGMLCEGCWKKLEA